MSDREMLEDMLESIKFVTYCPKGQRDKWLKRQEQIIALTRAIANEGALDKVEAFVRSMAIKPAVPDNPSEEAEAINSTLYEICQYIETIRGGE